MQLFKLRLGDDKLQACEVMLRDVIESKVIDAQVNSAIMTNIAREKQIVGPPPNLHAQILSSFFWPALREDEFSVPLEIAAHLENYGREFERIKSMRKLHWLPALGRATVELQLEDRAVVVEAQTWQASVVYAFQDPDGMPGVPVSRSVEELVETLGMEEAMVRSALTFWVGRMVLREAGKDVYAVLETLERDRGGREVAVAAAAAAAAAEAEARVAPSAVKSQEDVLLENMAIYSQFILGMLTNQGAMPVARIHMMLKMVVPGGFPFGVDDVKLLLRRMVDEGKLTGTGETFGVKKDG